MRLVIGSVVLSLAALVLSGVSEGEGKRHRYFHLTAGDVLPVKGHRYDRVEMVWKKQGCFHRYEVRVSVRREGGALLATIADMRGNESRRTLTVADAVSLNGNINHYRAHRGMGASTNRHELTVSWFEGDTLRDRETYRNRCTGISRYEGESVERFVKRLAGASEGR